MDTSEDDLILDLSASCSKDQAVMRILGWALATAYPKRLHVMANGTLNEDSKLVYRPDFSLNEFLSEIYRDAKNAYLNSIPADATTDMVDTLLKKALPAIERAEVMIDQARSYMMDIVDELARGNASGLRLDKESTAKNGEEYITIRSLDEWCSAKYQVIEEPERVPFEDDPSMGALKRPVSEMSKTEIGLYTVLGLLTEAYAKELGETYFSKSGEVNVKQMSIAVAGHADTYMENDQHFPDQSVSTVRARLTSAEKCLAFQKQWKVPKSTSASTKK
jgi:hypothetical protein